MATRLSVSALVCTGCPHSSATRTEGGASGSDRHEPEACVASCAERRRGRGLAASGRVRWCRRGGWRSWRATGLAANAPRLRRHPTARRIATLVATVAHLQATSIDDCLELSDLLMVTELLGKAKRERRLGDSERPAVGALARAFVARHSRGEAGLNHECGSARIERHGACA